MSIQCRVPRSTSLPRRRVHQWQVRLGRAHWLHGSTSAVYRRLRLPGGTMRQGDVWPGWHVLVRADFRLHDRAVPVPDRRRVPECPLREGELWPRCRMPLRTHPQLHHGACAVPVGRSVPRGAVREGILRRGRRMSLRAHSWMRHRASAMQRRCRVPPPGAMPIQRVHRRLLRSQTDPRVQSGGSAMPGGCRLSGAKCLHGGHLCGRAVPDVYDAGMHGSQTL